MNYVDINNKVTLKESNLESNRLTLTVIDSQAATAESVIEVPVLRNWRKERPVVPRKLKMLLSYSVNKSC